MAKTQQVLKDVLEFGTICRKKDQFLSVPVKKTEIL